jgi:hypothetical protein
MRVGVALGVDPPRRDDPLVRDGVSGKDRQVRKVHDST